MYCTTIAVAPSLHVPTDDLCGQQLWPTGCEAADSLNRPYVLSKQFTAILI